MSIIPPAAPKFRFDLRSDILAPPSAAVLHAVAEAAGRPGEFGWRVDPIEQALERRVCEMLGKPAAALFPTCTAANIAGLVALRADHRPLVMGKTCHLMTTEMAGLEWLTQTRPLSFEADYRSFDPAHLPDEPDAIFCLENTHNRQGGTVMSADDTARVAGRAKAAGWSVFLDGSRLWNAAVASGDTPAALAGPVDLVSVSFNKGLGAPNGAALAGAENVIAAAVEGWRRLGGICRPSHVIAAGALASLDEMDRLVEDHVLARETAATIADVPGFAVLEPETNILLVSGQDLGLDGAALARELGHVGLGCLAFGPGQVRLVFHRGIPAGSAPTIGETVRRILS